MLSTVLLANVSTQAVLVGNQHNYINVSTADIINVMKSHLLCVSTFYCSETF